MGRDAVAHTGTNYTIFEEFSSSTRPIDALDTRTYLINTDVGFRGGTDLGLSSANRGNTGVFSSVSRWTKTGPFRPKGGGGIYEISSRPCAVLAAVHHRRFVRHLRLEARRTS